MQKTSVLITGAAGALGSAFAESLSASPDIDLHLADVDAVRLGALAARTGAIRTMAVNLFDEYAEMHNAVTRSDADVVVWNAAINVDQSQPVCDRSLLRERQNASLLRRIEAFEESDTARRRLLVVVNSVTALFGQNPDIANFWNRHADELQLHYGRMKGE
jgi:nucleoside-diphosphate-sugar epimerase